MLNPDFFTERALQVGYKVNLDSQNINHASSKIFNKPNFHELGTETRYISEILKEMAIIYARIINQYKLKYQTVFSARFDKQDEDNPV